MKRRLFAFVIFLLLASCDAGDEPSPASPTIAPTSTPSPSPTPMRDAATLDVAVEKNRSPRVTVTSNLPDGAELIVMLTHRNGKSYQDKGVLKQGRFQSESFGGESGLPRGKYTVDATVAVAAVQPASVRAIVGQNGEHLTGKFAKQHPLGTLITSEKAFTVK